MKLLFTCVDPHVERAEVDVRISRESQPGNIKQSGETLIRYGKIDVLEQLHVTHVFSAAVVVAHDPSPVIEA